MPGEDVFDEFVETSCVFSLDLRAAAGRSPVVPTAWTGGSPVAGPGIAAAPLTADGHLENIKITHTVKTSK